MKIKKREAMFLVFILVLILCMGIGVYRMLGKESDKEANKHPTVEKEIPSKESAKKIKKEERKALEFENLNLLESAFMLDEIEALKMEMLEFLSQDSKYDVVKKIVWKEAPIVTGGRVEFYSVLYGINDSVLRGIYKQKDKAFRFWTEDITASEMDEEWKEVRDKHTEISGWKTEDELPIEWTYVEEDETVVSLTKKELLVDKIPKEKLEKLETEILDFLKENNEYRRGLEVQKEVDESEKLIEFMAKFKTPRIDGKDLHIVYEKSGDVFRFSL